MSLDWAHWAAANPLTGTAAERPAAIVRYAGNQVSTNLVKIFWCRLGWMKQLWVIDFSGRHFFIGNDHVDTFFGKSIQFVCKSVR